MIHYILAEFMLQCFYLIINGLNNVFSKKEYKEKYNYPEKYPELNLIQSGRGKINFKILYIPSYYLTGGSYPNNFNNGFWNFQINGHKIHRRGIYQ